MCAIAYYRLRSLSFVASDNIFFDYLSVLIRNWLYLIKILIRKKVKIDKSYRLTTKKSPLHKCDI